MQSKHRQAQKNDKPVLIFTWKMNSQGKSEQKENEHGDKWIYRISKHTIKP